MLRKKLIFTAHNIDAAARDGRQSWRNRFSLWVLYHIVDHIIVHTERMKEELIKHFRVAGARISVIPHGIMSAVPETALTRDGARRRLGIVSNRRVILFFGLIAPYKGLELLVEAMGILTASDRQTTLLIAGKVKGIGDKE